LTAKTDLTAARSGVYRTPQSADGLRERAAAAQLDWLEADLAAATTKTKLLGALAAAGGFPAGFGHNWDALADALGDLSWRPAAGYVLRLSSAPQTQRALGADWHTLLDVLRAAAEEWKARGKPFVVLIDDAALPAWA
jgi:hypothetical protein